MANGIFSNLHHERMYTRYEVTYKM